MKLTKTKKQNGKKDKQPKRSTLRVKSGIKAGFWSTNTGFIVWRGGW